MLPKYSALFATFNSLNHARVNMQYNMQTLSSHSTSGSMIPKIIYTRWSLARWRANNLFTDNHLSPRHTRSKSVNPAHLPQCSLAIGIVKLISSAQPCSGSICCALYGDSLHWSSRPVVALQTIARASLPIRDSGSSRRAGLTEASA